MSSWSSFLVDAVVNQFLYYRLGNTVLKPNHYEYIDMSVTEIMGIDDKSGRLPSQELQISELPTGPVSSSSSASATSMIRVCIISDTHERHGLLGVLPVCDILIHAGDILMTGRMVSTHEATRKISEFNDWLGRQPIKHRIVLAGNHDVVLEELGMEGASRLLSNATYLCNSETTAMGLRIWGTPLSSGKSGNSAFQSEAFAQATHDCIDALLRREQQESDGTAEAALGSGIDILVTHGTGDRIAKRVRPKIARISGHVHALHGIFHRKGYFDDGSKAVLIGAPIMNTKLQPHQLPVVVDFPVPVKCLPVKY